MTAPVTSPDRTDGTDHPDECAAIVESVDGTEECTLFPRDASDVDLLSRWITARGDAFVSLESMR